MFGSDRTPRDSLDERARARLYTDSVRGRLYSEVDDDPVISLHPAFCIVSEDEAGLRRQAPSAGAEDPCMQDQAEAELRRLKAERRRADDADDEIEVARLSTLIQAIMATQFVVPEAPSSQASDFAEPMDAATAAKVLAMVTPTGSADAEGNEYAVR